MDLQRDLARAVAAAGGAEALRELGSATTNRALHTRLAWELRYPIQHVERGYGHRVVLRTSDERIADRRAGVGEAGFTSPLQGIHIRSHVAGSRGSG
jgi:hypothetical protein